MARSSKLALGHMGERCFTRRFNARVSVTAKTSPRLIATSPKTRTRLA